MMTSVHFTASIEFANGAGAHDEQLDLTFKQQKLDCFRDSRSPASDWGIVISNLRRDARSPSGYSVDIEILECACEEEGRKRIEDWREATQPGRNWGLGFWGLVFQMEQEPLLAPSASP